MVKLLFVLTLFASSLLANTELYEKVESLIGSPSYAKNRSFIKIIFTPESDYFQHDHLDVVKVAETLRDNGLLDLKYDAPMPLHLTFITNGSPMFFVKLMGDTLSSMGHYRYNTYESKLDNSTFYWKVTLNTKAATDPVDLREELYRRGCDIIDIERIDAQEWTYTIDMSKAHLRLDPLKVGEEVVFKRSLYAHWLDISNVEKMTIKSTRSNKWYPYLAYYDSSLRLLKVDKRDKKSRQVTITPPQDSAYLRIADLYTLKNIKDGLRVEVDATR